jgi:thioredoxin reductase
LFIAPALGGQLMAKGVDVENYPGMPRENGGKMIQVFKQQAQSFFADFMEDTVLSVNVSQRPFTIETSTQGVIKAHSMIISTGADSRWLDVEGEYEYRGHGVSACAACDGYLYKGRPCAVIGGGDTAMEAALMLQRICSSVTVIHRRESFRASWALQQRVLSNSRISVRWNTDVLRFVGRKKNVHGQWQKFLTHVELSDPRDRLATADKLSVDAVFVAIGHNPNTGFLYDQVETDAEGYLSLFESSTKTSVPGVFAAGDVADHTYRQAVTSAGTGSMAALDVEKYLSSVDMEEDQCVRQEDFSGWSLKDLRAQVKLLGLKCSACYEPSDFVATLRASF